MLYPEAFKEGLSLYTTPRRVPSTRTCLLYHCDYFTSPSSYFAQPCLMSPGRTELLVEAPLASEGIARHRGISDVCSAQSLPPFPDPHPPLFSSLSCSLKTWPWYSSLPSRQFTEPVPAQSVHLSWFLNADTCFKEQDEDLQN